MPAEGPFSLAASAPQEILGPQPDLLATALPSPAGRTATADAVGPSTIAWAGELPADPEQLQRTLGTLRSRLDPDGRLLLVVPLGAPAVDWPPPGLPAALAENGFVVTHASSDSSAPAAAVGMLWARADTYRIRGYQPGDEHQILDLFARSFGVVRSSRRWAWEYLENPLGNARLSLALSPDHQLVAQYAGYPVRLACSVAGAPTALAAHHIGDTMTAPAVRAVGRGPTSVLGRTVRHFYSRYCEGQVAFNYGVNTGNIQKFSTKFVGAQRLEPIPYHAIDAAALRSAPRVDGFWSGLRVEPIERVAADYDTFFRRVRAAYGLLVERNASYLDWRYLQCPDGEYRAFAVRRWGRLCGWSVVRAHGAELRWGDALFDPSVPGAPRTLLSSILALPEFRHIERVAAWLPPRPAWWGRAIAELGFEPAPEPQDLGFMIVPFRENAAELAAQHLYYSMGDSDLF